MDKHSEQNITQTVTELLVVASTLVMCRDYRALHRLGGEQGTV